MSRPTSAHPSSVIASLRLWRGLKQDTAPLRAVFSPMMTPCAGVVAASVRRRTHPRAQVGVARLRLLRRPGVRHRTDAVRYVPYKTASHPGHHYVVPVNSASLLQEPAMKSHPMTSQMAVAVLALVIIACSSVSGTGEGNSAMGTPPGSTRATSR